MPQIASLRQKRLPVVVKTEMMLINPPQSTKSESVGMQGHEYIYTAITSKTKSRV